MIVYAAMMILLGQDGVDEILGKMERKAISLTTMVATYEQVKTLSLLDEETKTRGKLYFDRKKGTTRWHAEDGTIQQLDQSRYIAVFPDLKEVEIYPLKKRGSIFATILGAPNASPLKEEFEVTLVSRSEKAIELKLLPRNEFLKKRIREARLEINPKTDLIQAATYTEKSGDTVQIRFQETVLNTKFSAGTFTLELDDLRAKGYNIREHK